jgi:squalene cyclase
MRATPFLTAPRPSCVCAAAVPIAVTARGALVARGGAQGGQHSQKYFLMCLYLVNVLGL